jgi:hypothetical protein
MGVFVAGDDGVGVPGFSRDRGVRVLVSSFLLAKCRLGAPYCCQGQQHTAQVGGVDLREQTPNAKPNACMAYDENSFTPSELP